MTQGPSVHPADETTAMFDVLNDELTKNLQAYLDGLPKLVSKYSRYLENTKALNPKALKRRRDAGDGPISPLLRCQKRDDILAKSGSGSRLSGEFLPPVDVSLRAGDSYCDLLEEAAAHPTEKTQDDIAQFLRLLEVRPTGEAQNLPQPPEDKLLNINMDALTCEAYQLRVLLSGVCEWIEMQMPAIKLEDNAGVAIQETVLRHLVHMRTGIVTVNDRHRAYTDKVADFCSQYYKHPHAARQWAQSLVLWNNDHWDQLERDWREVRQIAIMAGRLISLNMEKLATPRETGANRFMCM